MRCLWGTSVPYGINHFDTPTNRVDACRSSPGTNLEGLLGRTNGMQALAEPRDVPLPIGRAR